MRTRHTHPIPWYKQLLFTVLILVGLLSAGEVAIRLYAYYFRTPYERFNYHTGRLELVPNVRYLTNKGREFRINSKGFVGPEFDDEPPPGVYRIVALGDSSTFTLGLWQMAYPAVMERLLNIEGGHRRVEVINSGIEGYNSEYALARVREEIIPYRPQLVTIFIGWNDLMKINPTNLDPSGRYTVLARLIERSYLMKAYKKLIFVHFRPLVFRPSVDPNAADMHAYDAFVPREYQGNLEEIIQLLRKENISAVLFTLPTVVRAGMSQEELNRSGVFFPYFAGTYSVDKFLSLHRAYNRTIRKIGHKFQVPVVDLDAIFNRLPKENLFWDTMHPNAEGNRVIATAVSQRLRELGI